MEGNKEQWVLEIVQSWSLASASCVFMGVAPSTFSLFSLLFSMPASIAYCCCYLSPMLCAVPEPPEPVSGSVAYESSARVF